MGERFLVSYIKIDNCFAYVSDTWLRRQGTKNNVIAVSHKDATYFLSCSPRQITDRALCLSAPFAKSLNIEEGDEVFVSFVKDVSTLTSITVVPRTDEDREILELQVDKIQSTLLNKIQIVAQNQPIVIWVSKFSTIVVTTEMLEPNFPCGKLEQFTEVHVTNEIRTTVKREIESNDNRFNLCNRLKKLIPTFSETGNNKKNELDKNYALLQNYRQEQNQLVVYRVHFFPELGLFDSINPVNVILRSPYNVFVSRLHLPKEVQYKNDGIIYKIKKVPEEQVNVNTESTHFLKNIESSIPSLSSELTVKVFILEDLLDKFPDDIDKIHFKLDYVHSNIYISESVRIGLRLKMGAKVVLSPIEVKKNSIPLTIEIYPMIQTTFLQNIKDFFERYSIHQKVLLNSCAPIKLNDGNRCIVKFLPEKCTHAFLDKELLKNIAIHLKSKLALDDLLTLEYEIADDSYEKISMRHLENILSECQITLDLSLRLNAPTNLEYNRENILICGEVGSGKSTLCKILMKRLQKSPYFVYTHLIDCISFKGRKVEMLQKIICAAISQCIYHQPSVLFLENIESITMISSNNEENNTPDSVNAFRVTDMIINTVMQCQESHYVSVIATCVSMNNIGKKMRPSKGSNFFRTILSMPNLEKPDRIDILQLMLEDKLYVPGNVNWDYYGNKTEGWMVQDLVDVADKATFVAWKRCAKEDIKPPIVITEDDISNVLKNYKPLSLQGVQLYKGSDHTWSDIGGLVEIKKSLTEILHWPLKYPEIFKNAPIKLQSGVLLYGMPGTGKTLLGKAIANECGVNLISVKGPELLSKYIGVSEESVRKIFERALRAKPCVIFFDEFDSLAPRRGHDSTGVTDRVVNQLLTQLDGIEDREGVAIVAATSRPDLLDPALLRPGRLDKSLYCPLPNEVERKEILHVLCQSQNINVTELDLKEIARISDELTGADLNAIITQAKLAAFEDAVKIIPEEKIQPSDIKVTQEHLVESAKSIKPSLSSKEIDKYLRIYARFSKNDTFVEDILKNQKTTLA
ncbi:peroxisome biogenesis factor 1 [Polistes fuscatus]|uniref:peroxisome biogenesis factor 1 n=1 Tax=Polistes fuscatus TaxID=30207 RepID=UPI001CA7C2BB|nr:peroxisome biogenesis factor 1 [Polistes fuscatus]